MRGLQIEQDPGRRAAAASQSHNSNTLCERLAEYRWKPHRVFVWPTTTITGLDVLVHALATEGYGFIEFEDSNSTYFNGIPPTSPMRRLSGRTGCPWPTYYCVSLCYVYIYIYILYIYTYIYIYIYIYLYSQVVATSM